MQTAEKIKAAVFEIMKSPDANADLLHAIEQRYQHQHLNHFDSEFMTEEQKELKIRKVLIRIIHQELTRNLKPGQCPTCFKEKF